MARHRLTDKQWELIEKIFPEPAATGRPPTDPRKMVDGILWRLRTGSPWRDLPAEFGPWETVFKHFDRWNSDGTLDQIKRTLLRKIVDAEGVDFELWCVEERSFERLGVPGAAEKKGSRRTR